MHFQNKLQKFNLLFPAQGLVLIWYISVIYGRYATTLSKTFFYIYNTYKSQVWSEQLLIPEHINKPKTSIWLRRQGPRLSVCSWDVWIPRLTSAAFHFRFKIPIKLFFPHDGFLFPKKTFENFWSWLLPHFRKDSLFLRQTHDITCRLLTALEIKHPKSLNYFGGLSSAEWWNSTEAHGSPRLSPPHQSVVRT